MPPRFENFSGVDDINELWETYYLRVEADGDVFFKIGYCKGSVRRRFKKEPSTTTIRILKLWLHHNEDFAIDHEEYLFRRYPGDRPYIGQCGPFVFGGNTETFSHDVIGGEPSPHSYIAKILTLSHGTPCARCYIDRNPCERYAHLYGKFQYMESLHGPPVIGEGEYLQVPDMSSSKRVVLATRHFIDDLLRNDAPSRPWFRKREAREVLDHNIAVRHWRDDYPRMRFYGDGFEVDQWTTWA